MKKERDSKIELLRIVLMFMIVVLHVFGYGYGYEYQDKSVFIRIFINSFTIVAVNVYIFISGYYGIRFSFKSLFSLIAQALMYSISILLVFKIFTHHNHSATIISSIFPISSGLWWFLPIYIALYILSPALNLAIDKLEKKQLTTMIVGSLFINCFGGFIFKTVSGGGLSIFNFATIYLLAAYLKKIQFELKYPKLIYIFSSISVFLVIFIPAHLLKELACFNLYSYYDPTLRISTININMYSYNNPILIISTIALFYSFKNSTIKNSTWINRVASLSFGVYLIHHNPFVWDEITRVLQYLKINYGSSYSILILLFIFCLSIFIVCLIIEWIRQLITKTSVERCGNWLDTKLK